MIQNWTLPTDQTDSEKLREFRSIHRLSQEELGLLVGRSRSTIASYENGGDVDGAVSGMVKLLRDRPTSEILARMRENREPATTPIQNEVIDLVRFLNEGAESKSYQVRPDDPESEWRTERGINTKRFRITTIERVGQATVPMSEGGALTRENLRAAIGPLAIDSRLSRLGVRYVGAGSDRSDSKIAVLSDPSCYWLNEADPLPEIHVSMASAATEFRTVATALALSRRLLRQTGDSGLRSFAASMTRALARAIDKAILVGSGVNGEPRGIINAELQQFDGSGDFGEAFYSAIEQLELNGANSESLSIVVNPTTRKWLSQNALEAEPSWSYQMQGTPGRQTFRGYPCLSLPSVPVGSMILGDFGQVTARIADEVEMRILDSQRADGAHEIYAFADVALENPFAASAFAEVSNVHVGS